MPQIVPAILTDSKEDFLAKASLVVKLPGVHRIQVDFADGHFVPNKLLSPSEIDALNPAFHWEAHLMVNEPMDFLDYNICGFKTILIHYEAYNTLENLKKAVQEIKSFGIEPGVVINNDTDPALLKDLAGDVRQFQIMGIEPGFQGQPFLENTYGVIKKLREAIPHAVIEVDGGVHFDNVKKLAEAGADLIIAGSVLTEAPTMLEAYEKLQSLII